jgi:hypothetical protein
VLDLACLELDSGASGKLFKIHSAKFEFKYQTEIEAGSQISISLQLIRRYLMGILPKAYKVEIEKKKGDMFIIIKVCIMK